MSNLPLGKTITTYQEKDAIHVAVAPVEAGQSLTPGAHVKLAPTGRAELGEGDTCIGIVDPFLKASVKPGERFWLFLYPGTITSLRHDWSHPAFNAPEPTAISESERWLRAFAAENDLTYNTLMAAAEKWVNSKHSGGYGAYYVGGEEMEGKHVPDEFWPHYEKVMNVQVAEEHRGSFFSCSC